MSRIAEYIARVEFGLERAENEHSKLTQAQMDLEGMSSVKNRILLNELVKDNDFYLEIGVYRGSTFVAALYENHPKLAIAIDNFSQFEGGVIGANLSIFYNVVEQHIPHMRGKCGFLNADCFNLNSAEKALLPKDINVYFYDGAHEAIDQKLALTYYNEFLADQFIYIVDDWNYEPARVGTRQGIEELGLTIHKEWEMFTDRNGATESWWNGFYVAVCEKAK
jgi:hypothetical protein